MVFNDVVFPFCNSMLELLVFHITCPSNPIYMTTHPVPPTHTHTHTHVKSVPSTVSELLYKEILLEEGMKEDEEVTRFVAHLIMLCYQHVNRVSLIGSRGSKSMVQSTTKGM